MSCREHGSGNYSANPSSLHGHFRSELLSPEQLHKFIGSYGVSSRSFGLGSMVLPLPGKTGLVLASVCAGSYNGNIVMVILKAPAGAIVGDNLGFMVGRELGGEYCSPMVERSA